jgi:hypothetical protein
MTQTDERTDVIAEAMALIDRGLTDLLDRQLVSADEVANLLLDVRSLLSTELDGDLGAVPVTGAAN